MSDEQTPTELESAAFDARAKELAELEEQCSRFRRNAKAEKMIGVKFECLDHGFVELVDYMGSDADIERAARVSYTGGEDEVRPIEKTRTLLRMLMRHRHTTPFEMCVMKFRIAVPMFVWRQWIRHRTASVNEFSGRYTELPDLTYVPDLSRMQKQSAGNHQGSADELIDNAANVRDQMAEDQVVTRDRYEEYLATGMAKELARINTPLGQYTLAVWKMDLHNLMHFLKLRLDPHAQYEIRVFAEAIADVVCQCFPISWEAFEDYVRNAVTFSAAECFAIRSLLLNEAADLNQVGLSVREQKELEQKLRSKLKLDVNLFDVAEDGTPTPAE